MTYKVGPYLPLIAWFTDLSRGETAKAFFRVVCNDTIRFGVSKSNQNCG